MKIYKNSKEIIQLIVKKIEKHYEDKFTYAIPEWAILSANPEIVYIIPVHGTEGVTITKQRVDFNVNFSDIKSIIHYAQYLSDQMNIKHEILGYIVFLINTSMQKKILLIKMI
ncbi:hypothetical protein [Faecalibacter rhinopitheci]|uniref:Uncharacterized protein n=1 Tax=Faecalibacter rhinopitheci TaxID=2779678 RepID=A0A8J7G7X3_9FLAO|nr:hypothetical protein [Faecalibacter rhinopitheci]MBF0598412.1 hypothetical protein [Faecalibacter rhinopitheci]